MRGHVFLFIFLFPMFLFSQSIFQPGLGVSSNLHLFKYKKGFSIDNQHPLPKNLIGFNAFLHFNTNSRFQFRTNLHFGEKRVSLFSGGASGLQGIGNISETIHHEFYFIDISVLSFYKLNTLKKVNDFEAILGFYLSLNQYVYTSYSSSVRSNGVGTSGGTGIFPFQSELEESPTTFYAGINAGINYRINKTKRPIDIYLMGYISPLSLFELEFENTNNIWGNISGSYHHFSLGVNLFLRKQKV